MMLIKFCPEWKYPVLSVAFSTVQKTICWHWWMNVTFLWAKKGPGTKQDLGPASNTAFLSNALYSFPSWKSGFGIRFLKLSLNCHKNAVILNLSWQSSRDLSVIKITSYNFKLRKEVLQLYRKSFPLYYPNHLG